MNSDNDDDDDDSYNSREGKMTRNLFRTADDSESSDDDGNEDTILHNTAISDNNNNSEIDNIIGDVETSEIITNEIHNNINNNATTKRIRRKVLNTWLDEDVIGGSIEHRLWPAATFLASFLLDLMISNNICHNNNHQKQQSMTPDIDNIQQHDRNENNDSRRDEYDMKKKKSIEEVYNQLKNILHVNDSNNNNTNDIHILEIGSGIGLVGLELANQFHNNVKHYDSNKTSLDSKQNLFNTKILLTDLDTALPLLKSNIQLNFPENNDDENDYNTTENEKNTQHYSHPKLSIHAQKLDWSNHQDALNALTWFHNEHSSSDQDNNNNNNTNDIKIIDDNNNNLESSSSSTSPPILIVGSDCVYWECLHQPLEECLLTLLLNAPMNSLCILAGMRRWKRDTTFYNQIGNKQKKKKNTNTDNVVTGYLDCVCILEQVTPSLNIEGGQREIMRIYAIRLIRTNN